MEKYKVTGMSCAACVARVEKAVKSVCGVERCDVNLLMGSMNVEGTAQPSEIISAVCKAGYGASLYNDGKEKKDSDDSLKDTETPKLRKRLLYSLGFLLLLMYVSMGYTMWGFPLPNFLERSTFAIGLIQAILSLAIIIINIKFFVNGIKGIIHLSPNMDTLVSLGSGVSYGYSLVRLIQMAIDTQNAKHILHDLYFESAGMILVLITVGKMLEAYSKGKTTNALKELISLQPKTAIVLVDGKEMEIDVTEIKAGDIFIVKTGGGIPVDATVIEGEGTVNESALTGESIPSDKTAGDKIYAGTVSQSGYLRCRADTSSQETVLSEIIKTVSDSASSKAPIARIADKVSGVFVPCVMAIALVTIVVWLILGAEVGFSLARGISVLVISCPCALGLATPVAIMVGNGVGAKNGILFKNATALENTGRASVVVLDKTGTITKGEPTVTDIIPFNCSEEELMEYACSLEIKSEHPLAKAIVIKGEEMEISVKETSDFQVLTGSGVAAIIGGEKIYGGNYKSVSSNVGKEGKDIFVKLSKEGKTPMFFVKGEKLMGVIAVRDEIKEDSQKAIEKLKSMGIKTVMLTGDNKNSANAIGEIVGVDKVISDVMPMDKERVVSQLKKEGRVIMVGDGINDAPALTSADIGIAIGQGTEIAVESAQVVLVKNSLMGVYRSVKLSRGVLRNIHQNLFWAFIYNVIGIPLAAGCFIGLFGWQMNPMFGALAMSLSSFCVVTNALRLNLINLSKENEQMLFKKKKTGIILNVEGMMCPHCEARVKKAVEEIEGVEEAAASHKKKTVTVFGQCDIEKVKSVIAEQGYTVK